MKEKMCPTCKETKLSEFFSRNVTRKDGLHWQCRVCKKESDRLTRIKAKQKGIDSRKKKTDAKKVYARAKARSFYEISKLSCSVMNCSTMAEELHHVNYDDPLAVIPLCRKHHEFEHHK